jgi:hypothetical protein
MKVKCAFGDFKNTPSRGNEEIAIIYNDPLGMSTHASIHAIPNKCYVMGVNLFNTDSNEKDVRFYDTNYKLTSAHVAAEAAKSPPVVISHYSAIQTFPKVYSTIVPRDQAWSRTWNVGVIWSTTVKFDLYDTPSGIYDQFPEPGFLFENGVTVNLATASTLSYTPTSKTYYQIFYVEA